MKYLTQFLLLLVTLCPFFLEAQEIELFQQFNGRYDYLSFGNTLNIEENTGGSGLCDILTESSASFQLNTDQTLVAAFLYWAGSGDGDFDVTLQGVPVAAERTFIETLNNQLFYFSAFADVTSILQSNGNGLYTLSDLDLTNDIAPFCQNTTNFGGWAVTVIFEDADLNLNQLNVFDGLEGVSAVNTEIVINLDNLNVLDNTGAKIGFLAWEGDSTLAVDETLQVNGNIISNSPLNPPENAFNSTNTFTNSTELFNMDIDFYSIENNIQPGDQQAEIKLTSGQDFIMINNVITVLNIELPDATIGFLVTNGSAECGDRELEIEYTVSNVNSTDTLPEGTPIAFYADNTLIGQAETQQDLPIDATETNSIELTIPESVPPDFQLRAVVDDTGNGNGIVNEINETNNDFIVEIHLLVFPDVSNLQDLELCDVFGTELFDLTEATSGVSSENIIEYYTSEADANNQVNPITNPEAFENTENPQSIWIRVANPDCFVITSFSVEVIICPLPDATTAITNNLNACRGRAFVINYTVFNTDGTAPLPSNTPIAFYIDGSLIAQSQTQNIIPQGGSETGSVSFFIPDSVPDNFTLLLVVDDDGTGMESVQELNEFNNEFKETVHFMVIPPVGALPELVECDQGFDTAFFDLTQQDDLILVATQGTVTYFLTEIDALENIDPILDPERYENSQDPQTIWVRLENEICFDTTLFTIATENCKPFIPEGFSPNNDGVNDEFEITGLLNIFEDFELKIFSRNGNLIYEGGNEDGFWNAIPNRGAAIIEGVVPVGTYYYALFLNDPEFPEPFLGFVYINY
ncbi:gliding motility-associated C-terminal domain-containing protein [Patiriisocius hiemis]|uniref:Gliding motility-associated C-terminal domain-containing protein n=1 Tax=Patiriisocius hiemis TaxID=3075604 RepID=A0ABU2YAB1_9FLAO|nr:gliding motility-associated C-terminal domain-containing protein [Constantimarinum sp. W242]MDT0555126.1 gliding motility-associated C-terminal domain-containing protein [Constantimarinum sp. W242]